ncbi:MAG: hypothetical protein LBR08_02845 [Bacteroidales bacterium]|nr:hypothetical protein [Bacteroidales bacterium]
MARRIKNIRIVLLALLFSARVTAQADHERLQTILTDIVSQSEEEQDTEQWFEQLETLSEHPVHINQASHDELKRLFWLTEFQINSLFDHVNTKGSVLSHYEIAYLYGFTPELVQSMLPFISLETKQEVTKFDLRRAFRYGKHKLITGAQSTLQPQEGYARPDSVENRYRGSPLKTSLRYSFSYADRLYFGITAEKDAGEAFFKGNNPAGFDFYSMHFQLNTKGRLKNLVLGDFRADFGQGLTLWSGMNYGKTAMLMNAVRYNERLRRYASADENRFLRGAGFTLAFNPVDVTVFYSRKPIDASVSETDENEKALSATAFPNTGYHRTTGEIAQKDRATEQITGIHAAVTRINWHVGVTAVDYRYDVALNPRQDIYRHFAFSGKSNSNYSIDFRFRSGAAVFYGEQALSGNGAFGGIYGSQMLIGEHLVANVLYRRYAKDFHALYGNALGENTRNNNEEGFYMGGSLDMGGQWRFAAYWDIFRFPWLRYRTDAPSFGQDVFVQTDYVPSGNTKIYCQLRYKEKEENLSGSMVSATGAVRTASAKMVFAHRITENISIGNHLEIKNFRKEQTAGNGYFLSQDLHAVMTVAGQDLQIHCRYAFFDTDDYNTRIYTYENDMLYAFGIPAFYERGTRVYLLLRYAPGKHLDFRVRFAATHYTDRTSIGSGLDEIQGNRRSEMKVQMVCKF